MLSVIVGNIIFLCSVILIQVFFIILCVKCFFAPEDSESVSTMIISKSNVNQVLPARLEEIILSFQLNCFKSDI